MTSTQWLLLPAFIHVAMVFALGLRLAVARIRAARSRSVKIKDVALDNSRWPDDIRKISNNFDNQFQVPVFFYAVLPLLLVTGLADVASVVLAWAFVASRFVHSAIHIGTNTVIHRFQAFVVGFVLVVLMWAWFGLRLFAIG
jgi:hypothetical protein